MTPRHELRQEARPLTTIEQITQAATILLTAVVTFSSLFPLADWLRG